MARRMKVTISGTLLIVVISSALITVYYMYNTYRKKQFLIEEHEKNTRFDSNMTKINSLRILSGIAIRNIDNEWASADDICQTGIVFPSTVLTSTLQNYSVYFHDEDELQTTFDYMTKNGSWGRRNLHTLMKPLDKYQNAFFIDIYAGLGLFSLPIVKLGLRVIAVEYRYSFAERLCRGIVAGQFKHKAFIVNNLVSDRAQTINIQPKHVSQRSAMGMDTSGDLFTRVSSIQLNLLLDRFPVEEAVIKIDMTTGDIDTILNSGQFFDTVKVHYVLMEWINIARSKDALRLINFMSKYKLIPCLNTTCSRVLKSDEYATWPVYVFWVNTFNIMKPYLQAKGSNTTSEIKEIQQIKV